LNKELFSGVLLRFVTNQELSISKRKLKKLIFLDSRNPIEISVALENVQSLSDYKEIAQSTDSSGRNFIAFSKITVGDVIANDGKTTLDNDPFEGHANILFDFIIEDNKPLPNALKDRIINLQKSSLILIDSNLSEDEFRADIYTVDQVNHKKLVIQSEYTI